MNRVASESVSPEVAAKIASWRPRKIDPTDAEAVEIVLPAVRTWVAAVEPRTPGATVQMLWATTQMALWWHQHFGNFDAAEMLTLHNVEHFAMFVNAGRSDGWRHCARANLRRVGRTVNPGQWPLMAPTVGFRDAMAPYQQQQESRFARAALLPGRLNRAARIWVVVASFGAGLNGREASAATVDDLREHNDDRIVVTVRGTNARRVPIRRSYTAMAREAITASDGTTFFRGTSPQAAYRVAERLPHDPVIFGNRESLSFTRARNTWIVAHLTAPTPFAALRAVAGPISSKTLYSLIRHVHAAISMDEAVEAALGA